MNTRGDTDRRRAHESAGASAAAPYRDPVSATRHAAGPPEPQPTVRISPGYRSRRVAVKIACRSAAIGRYAAAAAVLVAGPLALVSCGAGADVSGTWEGQMVSQNDEAAYEVTLDLEEEGDELTGSGTVTNSGTTRPIDVTGGDVEGSKASAQFEDRLTGQAFTGELQGDLSGDQWTGESQIYSQNSSGPIEDTLTFELEQTEG